jgi:phosphonatase-like hydrolase
MIELVVFDLAGTTVQDGDAVNSAFRAALAGAGVEASPARVNAVMGLAKPEAIRRLLAEAGRLSGQSDITAIHEDFVRRMCRHYAEGPEVGEVPGAAATFARLRRAGIQVALGTGFSRQVVEVLLERLGWRVGEVIDATVASDEVARGRPAPDMIRHLMARLGVADARKVAKVGDTEVDLAEGANAGCGLVIGVTTGSCTAEQLRACPHTHVLASVVEVHGVVLG